MIELSFNRAGSNAIRYLEYFSLRSNTGNTNITALPQGETLTTQMIYYYDAAEKVYKSTGIATGPHLHFEAIKTSNNMKFDAETLRYQ